MRWCRATASSTHLPTHLHQTSCPVAFQRLGCSCTVCPWHVPLPMIHMPVYAVACVLQSVVVRCSMLQYFAVYSSVLRCVAVCCSVLQCVTSSFKVVLLAAPTRNT